MTLTLDPATGLLETSFPLPLDEPFSTATARAVGLRPNTLTRLVAGGALRRIVRGVYVAVQAGDSTALRARALRLVVPEDAVVVDRHAAWLLGAEMALAPGEHLELRPITVFRPPGRGRLRSTLVDSGERDLRPEDVTDVDGLRVTTALRTAWDLGRVRHPDLAIAGMDAVARLGLFTREELLGGVPRFARTRWVTTLRAVAPLVDGRAESPPESVLRLRWIQAGLPTPEPQVEVWEHGVLVARLDVGHRGLRLAAEYDGVEFHTSEAQVAHDRVRRGYLDAQRGWTLVVVTRPDLWGPGAGVEALLRRGWERSRARATQVIS
ncbi:hypothetical protein GCM10009737_20260 [Nocardioides lentus]|uniref:Transcriptional regulator, AbiEi antitoxin, Type IV TA system n=1 Tax=Nocardioides lentus TaxID=338077 RepID=A0ABN2PER1_9ACTN